MNRLLISVAAAALLSGCTKADWFGLGQGRTSDTGSVQTQNTTAPVTVIREIHRETPVVYYDTVYLEEQAPVETVYIEEEYETYVYVAEPVLLAPHPHFRHHRHGWRPREHLLEPRERRGGGGPGEPRKRPDEPKPPNRPATKYPPGRRQLPTADDLQESPDKPKPPAPPAFTDSPAHAPAGVGATPTGPDVSAGCQVQAADAKIPKSVSSNADQDPGADIARTAVRLVKRRTGLNAPLEK